MTKSRNIAEKMILGTAQFSMDYGIANIGGKPTKKEVFGILDLAFRSGIKRFDTAPDYKSELLLGEFISANGLQNEAIVLTKIPSLGDFSNYKQSIKTSLELSLKNLGCPIDVLFFHNPDDSILLLKAPEFFDGLLRDYPISSMGVSIYETNDVEKLLSCPLELAFQFPFNVLDRRFEKVEMRVGKRYARSIFLQGLLASKNQLRADVPEELSVLQNEYHSKLTQYNLNPLQFALNFVNHNDLVDYFLIGVDREKQLNDILYLASYNKKDLAMFDVLSVDIDKYWFDPRNW